MTRVWDEKRRKKKWESGSGQFQFTWQSITYQIPFLFDHLNVKPVVGISSTKPPILSIFLLYFICMRAETQILPSLI